MTTNDIKLGNGIGELKFGMTRKQVKIILGEPDEIEQIEDDGETGASEAWHYDSKELSVTFDEEEEWRLTAMAASSASITFEGVDLLGLSQEETMQQIELMNLGEIEIDDVIDEDEDRQQVASIPEVSLNLWFDEGVLSEIQWGPFWDDEEETYIWPE